MTPAPLPAPAPSPATVVIDYQNVHLTAAGLFSGDRRIRDVLIDPVLFAQQLIAARNAATDDSTNPAVLSEVIVHRGLPALEYDPRGHHGNLLAGQGWLDTARAQQINMTICHSPLTYHLVRPARAVTEASAESSAQTHTAASTLTQAGTQTEQAATLAALASATDTETTVTEPAAPIARGREKGVDVRCALDLVSAAARGTKRGLVILASSDRDLTPALETAAAMRAARVEATAWNNRRPLQPEGLRLWTTFLGEEVFNACIDPRAKQYHRNAAELAETGAVSTCCSNHATIQTYSRATGLQS